MPWPARAPPPLSLHPFRPLKVGLVLTELPGLKESVMEGAVEATRAGSRRCAARLLPPRTDAGTRRRAVADALNRLSGHGAQVLLIAGASAVVDRRDVGPAAIVRAGGEIDHFGMPVDPGNLICLGHIDEHPGAGPAGLRKSPKLNGIDWVLQRLFAGLAVEPRDVMGDGRRRAAEGDRDAAAAARGGGQCPGAGPRTAARAEGSRRWCSPPAAAAAWRR